MVYLVGVSFIEVFTKVDKLKIHQLQVEEEDAIRDVYRD